MTLHELLQLIKRYWKLCVILPVVCALACAGYQYLKVDDSGYTVNSYVVAGSTAQVAAVNGAAASAARDILASNPGYAVTNKTENASQTLTITVTGPDEAKVVAVANEVANTAVDQASKLFTEEEPLYANVQLAVTGSKMAGSFSWAYVIVALLAGLFVAICIVIGIDAVRCPVKNASNLAEAAKLPVLGDVPGDAGERLLANMRFASGKEQLHTVLIVPVQQTRSAETVASMVSQAASAETAAQAEAHGGPIRVSACKPLQVTADAMYEAHAADAVVISAAQWADVQENVEKTVSQLKLAGANTVGCVLVRESAKN